MLNSFIHIIFIIVAIYFTLSVGYLFLFSVMGRWFFRQKQGLKSEPVKKIAILVPAYQEDAIIISTIKNLKSLDYPSHLYDVYVLADSFQPQTLQLLRESSVQVIEVKFDQRTKTKSLNEGFRKITKPYDIALICDADNILAYNFLKTIDQAFTQGARAIQGRRVAKNLDSSFAVLDACSEAINNNIFRRGANAMGLSSALIGSGMAFEYDQIKQILSEINAVGGFDKPLQLRIIEQGVNIQYLENALLFDEKVDSSDAFRQQRKRWVSSQFIYLKQFFIPSFKQLFRGNFSYFNLAFANNIVLPRAFLLLMLFIMVIISYLVGLQWGIYFSLIFFIYLLTLAISLPTVLINKDLLHAIVHLPKAISEMVMAFFQMKKANKSFIHTIHTKTKVSNTLYKDHGN